MVKKTDILRVKLTTDGAGKVKADLLGVNQSFVRLDQGADRLGNRMRSLGKAMGLAFGAVSVGVLAQQTREAVRYADQIGKVADKIGLSTDALQELRFAAERTGVAQTALDMGMQRFARRVGEVAKGEGVLKDVFKQNGIQIKDNTGRMRSLEAILGDYADVVGDAGSEQEQLRLAFKAFDSEGAAMVNTLRNGRDGLNDLREAAREAGVVMEEDLVRKAEKLNDRWDTLTETIGVGFKSAILNTLSFISGTSAITQMESQIGLANNRIIEITESLDFYNQKISELETAGAPPAAIDNIRNAVTILNTELDTLQSRIGQLRGEAPTGGLAPAKQDETDYLAITLEQYIQEEAAVSRAYDAKLRYIGSLENEVELLRYTGRELAIETKIMEAHTQGIHDQDDAIREMVGTLYDARDAQKELADSGVESFKELRQTIEGWGRSFASTLLDGEQDFKSFAQAIIRQLAEISIARASEPLFNLFADALMGVVGGSSTASTYGTTAGSQQTAMLAAQDYGFADGGVMTKNGPLPLREYATGGIVNSPQIRVAGERYQPEAIVPLPDGRSIPVEMQGGGQAVNFAPVFNIDARGADAGMLPRVKQIADVAARQALAEYTRSIRNGGTAARVVGRR